MSAATPNTAARREAVGYVTTPGWPDNNCRCCADARQMPRNGMPTIWRCAQHNFAIRPAAHCNDFKPASTTPTGGQHR